MKKWMLALLLFCQPYLSADAWLPAALPIPPGTANGVEFDICLTYDASNNTVVGAWSNVKGGSVPNLTPFYAIYNGSTWSTPGTVISSGLPIVQRDINLIFDPANNAVVASWIDDSATTSANYSIWNGLTWTTPTPISAVNFAQNSNDVNLIYNSGNSAVFAAWCQASSPPLLPYYSIWNGSLSVPSWTTPATISLGSGSGASSGVQNDVTLTYDAAISTLIAAWGDSSSSFPYYSISSDNGATWTTAQIPLGTPGPGTSTGVNNNVSLVYNPANNTVVAAWADMGSDLPYYTVYNGTSWTMPVQIPTNGSNGVRDNVILAYNSDSQTVFAAWGDSSSPHIPYYSILTGNTWTTGTIPLGSGAGASNGADFDVYLIYDPNSHQMIATWGDSSSFKPYYSTYITNERPIPPGPLPPTGLVGKQHKNDFATVSERYNTLHWQASPSSGVAGYLIYRNGILIATLNANVLCYQDHNQKKNANTLYSVVAINSQGIPSTPATVIVN